MKYITLILMLIIIKNKLQSGTRNLNGNIGKI